MAIFFAEFGINFLCVFSLPDLELCVFILSGLEKICFDKTSWVHLFDFNKVIKMVQLS